MSDAPQKSAGAAALERLATSMAESLLQKFAECGLIPCKRVLVAGAPVIVPAAEEFKRFARRFGWAWSQGVATGLGMVTARLPKSDADPAK